MYCNRHELHEPRSFGCIYLARFLLSKLQVRVEAGAVAQQACIRLVEILRSPDVSLEEQVDAVGYLQDLKYEGQEPLQACFDSQK